jgi:hypothetical protein
MIPECGWTGILPAVTATTQVKFYREGNTLRSNATIRLFDLNGNMVRVAGAGIASGHSEMDLRGLRQGMYVARSGAQTLRVQVK